MRPNKDARAIWGTIKHLRDEMDDVEIDSQLAISVWRKNCSAEAGKGRPRDFATEVPRYMEKLFTC